MFIHSTTTLPSLEEGDKKVRDLSLSSHTIGMNLFSPNELYFTPITGISTEEYNNWYKIIFKDDSFMIVDKNSKFLLEDNTSMTAEEIDVIHRLYSLSGETIQIKEKKEFGKSSLAYKLSFSDDVDIVFLGEVGLLSVAAPKV